MFSYRNSIPSAEMSAVTSLCWTLLSTCLLLVSAEQKNVTAESGQNVTLMCRAPNNKTIKGAEWSKADLEPEYLLVYRDGQFVPDLQHPSFKDRVELQDRQMKDGDVSVILTDVTTNDTGTYECCIVQRGINRRKRAHLKTDPISIIYLRVFPPAQPEEDTEIIRVNGRDTGPICRLPVDFPGRRGGVGEDGMKKDRRKDALLICLQIFVVLIVVVSFVILIEYKQRRKLEKRAASY